MKRPPKRNGSAFKIFFFLTIVQVKAAVHTRYGPPEVVELQEIEPPEPRKGEILIKVFASTVNRTDCGFRSAEYFISRFWSGLLKPADQTLGCEFAGKVEAIGREVHSFKEGDRVFGYDDDSFGGHAEYLTTRADGAITKVPPECAYEDIAPSTEGAHYALCNIRASGIDKGQKALVHGATGAIGSAAVQLLKHFGVKVTSVINTDDSELIGSLGSDRVIEEGRKGTPALEESYDLVLDAVGKSSYGRYKPLMKERGVYISTGLGKNGENIFRSMMAPLSTGRKVMFPIPHINKEDVEFLGDLVAKGVFRPLIDRKYGLDDIVEAYRYVETGQKIGNVVLRVRNEK